MFQEGFFMDALFFTLVAAIILIDQFSKQRVFSYLERKGFPVIEKKIITLRIAKNGGAALGLFENRRKFLVSLTIILMAVVVYYFVYSLKSEEMFLIKLSLSFILGGGIGNLIDRVKYKYVIDFFSFNFNRSPIFNLADIFIFIGVIILQITLIFFI